MRINEVERRVGVSKKNIRFYEEEGLLKPGRNAENGYREYSEADVEQLLKIRLLRQLSVPLEEIRRLQTGGETLELCMQRQQLELERRARDLIQISAVCTELAESGQTLDSMDVTAWEARITELERTGTRFMNVKNDRTKKILGPVLITALLCLLLIGAEVLLAQALAADPVPAGFLLLAVPVVIVIGLITALWLRVREIRGGEEDEAAQY